MTGARPHVAVIWALCGAALKQAREAAGLTRAELARQTGLTKNLLLRLEAGRQAWNAGILAQIRQAPGLGALPGTALDRLVHTLVQEPGPQDPLLSLAAILREARKRASLTVAQLAQLAGLSCGTLGNLEGAKCVPTARTLASLLGVQRLELHWSDLADAILCEKPRGPDCLPVRGRGLAALSPARRREIASLGGKRAQALGTAHKLSPEEARQAGRKGGTSVSRDREHMRTIGRAGGKARRARRQALPTKPGNKPKS